MLFTQAVALRGIFSGVLSRVLGRGRELGVLDSFFRSPVSAARTLILEGVAGVGKTTLWEAGLGVAGESQRVLSVRPVEAEAKLGYGGLADLIEPVVDEMLPVLPGPQRTALEVALLRAEPDGSPVDPRALGTALVGGVRWLVADRPLVVAIDDVQWLDASSVEALAFAFRRLERVPVSLFIARRLNGDRAADQIVSAGEVTRLAVSALDRDALGHLLAQRFARSPSRTTLERLFVASGGNPFYALELAAGLERHGGDLGSDEPLPVPVSLRQVVSERLRLLERQEREALLAAALLSEPDADLLEVALGGEVAGSLSSAAASGVIGLEGTRVRFAHPLYASVLVADASPVERRRMHGLLASAVGEPEQRARHRALAAVQPDEEVARLVEEAAVRASVRGAPVASADLLEQAARLSPSRDERGRRLTAAAQNLFIAAEPQRADALAQQALTLLPSGQLRADALTVLAAGSMHDVPSLLAVIEETLAVAGASAATRAQAFAMRSLARSILRLEPKAGLGDALQAVEAAAQVGVAELVALAASAQAWSEVLLGRIPTPILEERVLNAQRPFFRADRPQLARLVWRGELAAARDPLLALREQAFEHGDEESAVAMSLHLCELELRSGDWAAAERYADEMATYARYVPTVASAGDCYAAWLAAYRGDLEATRRHSKHGLRVSRSLGHELFALLNQFPVGMALLAAGEPADAVACLRPLFALVVERGLADPGEFPFVPDLIEALVGIGSLAEGEHALAWLEQQAQTLEHPWATAVALRCRGLVGSARAPDDETLAGLERSRDDLERLGVPFDSARSRLAYGIVLRRMRRRQAARSEFEAAVEAFDTLGARLWAARARAELARLGGRQAAGSILTSGERRVADLAAAGRTNKEIAAELFITENTVETHLKRVYAKLGIRSRAELARRLEPR